MSASQSPFHWQRFVSRLAEIGSRAHHNADTGLSAWQHGEIDQALIGALHLATQYAYRLDPDYPEWLPFLTNVLRIGNPCPDFIYHVCAIRAGGKFRVSGTIGRNSFTEIQVNRGLIGFSQSTEILATIRLDDLPVDKDGRFEMLLCDSAPDISTVAWRAMGARHEDDVLYLTARTRASNWAGSNDGHLRIERLDASGAGPFKDARDAEARLGEVTGFLDLWMSALANIMAAQKPEVANVNAFANVNAKFAGQNLATGQAYFHANYRLAPDEALLMSVSIEPDCDYWSVQLMDRYYNGLESIFHQSGLNDATAVMSGDGVLRVVVAHQDPGIANWLDTMRYDEGAVRWRFVGSAAPAIATQVVPLDQVRSDGGRTMPLASIEHRSMQRRARLLGSQNRHRW